ncbi:MAG: TonB-dependent receptor, partial [Alphaproteobacteria bacterium]|nr:TonB-dependent receptor [Alphaproteobacteria bacterium]
MTRSLSPLQRRLSAGVSALVLVALTTPAFAQDAVTSAPKAAAQAHPDDEAFEVDELVVTSSAKPRGSVIGDIPPEITLSPRDIRAYGVSNVSELITALAPQTSSGRGDGRPVILVNGQRISSFVEVRDLPTEAIMRVDILPEEVSLKYGYRADQRVINMVLRPRFRAVTAEAGFKTPTQGDGEVYEAKLNSLRIQQETRLLLDAKVSKSQPVLESDRDIANTTGDANFRSLSPDSESVTLTATYNRPIREGVAGGLNASFDASRNENLLGLPLGSNLTSTSLAALADPSALKRVADAVAAHAGGTMNGAIKGWSWSLTANADHSDTRTTTDRQVAGVAFTDKSRSVAQSGDVELVTNGVLARIAAGAVSTTLKVGLSTSSFDTRSLRAGVVREGDLSRDTGSFQANLDVPLTSRTKDVFAAIGDLSGNLNVAVDDLSDFGTLTTYGYGVNWTPIKPVRFIASFTEEENAPTVQQLGAPEQATPGVRVFDFRTGETVEVTRIEGGAPGLQADNRSVMKLGLTLKPFEKTDVTFSADYVQTRIKDVIASFPTATNEIEAAFPERFLRDASGRLIQIDSRPVNFDHRDTAQLRWGFTFRMPLGPTQPAGGQPGQGRPAGQQGQAGEQPRRQAAAGAAGNAPTGG